MKWLAPPNDMKTLPPMLGRAETMNELVPMVSVGATDHQIEGEITPLFNVSGLSERQPDHSSADLQSNKTARRKKITRKYQHLRKVRSGKSAEENSQRKLRREKSAEKTSRYEITTDGQNEGYLNKHLLVPVVGVTLFTSVTKMTESVQAVILNVGMVSQSRG